jgi:hypothetical protein
MEDFFEDLAVSCSVSLELTFSLGSGLAFRLHGNLIMSKPLGWSGSSALSETLLLQSLVMPSSPRPLVDVENSIGIFCGWDEKHAYQLRKIIS